MLYRQLQLQHHKPAGGSSPRCRNVQLRAAPTAQLHYCALGCTTTCFCKHVRQPISTDQDNFCAAPPRATGLFSQGFTSATALPQHNRSLAQTQTGPCTLRKSTGRRGPCQHVLLVITDTISKGSSEAALDSPQHQRPGNSKHC